MSKAKTVTTSVTLDVDVDVDLDDFDDEYLIDALECRGYKCVSIDDDRMLDRYDLIMLQEIIERLPRQFETEQLREKVLTAMQLG